jgi:NitT/TauT family transport system substrate-binding protein
MLKRISGCLSLLLLCGIAASIFSGCSAKKPANGLYPIKFLTDWYPQPEHGGFYDALIKGYYKDEGLDVTIVPGGPYITGDQQIAANAVQFGMATSDKILEAVGNDEPLIAVGATMQHDAQGIMVHAESPVHTFADLEGHTVAVKPGSTWFAYLERRFHFTSLRTIPATYSVSNFLQDPNYIQQVFITSEPFFARKSGAQVRTLLTSDAGYDPYRVYCTSTSFLKEHPEIVGKFVRASMRGWQDYMNDPTAANEAISKLNPAMSRDQMAFTYQALKDGHFITGSDPSGSQFGQFDPARWATMYQQLLDLKIVKKPFDPSIAYTRAYLNSADKTAAADNKAPASAQ